MPFLNNKAHLSADMRIQSEIEPQMCLSVLRVSGKDMCCPLFPCVRASQLHLLQLLSSDHTAPQVYFNLSLNDALW